MSQEVLLVSSSVEGNISAWDVLTGTALTNYKSNACPSNGISLLGNDYIISCQLGKPALHAWTWHKDQVHIRSFPPEPITSLACTLDGTYCVAGGASGAVHIWETASGRLLKSWSAHYKKVTCLAFSSSGNELVVGGEDTLVTAWLLPNVLDVELFNTSAVYTGNIDNFTPLHSWSDHTLPVSCVAFGAGCTGTQLVLSTSMDRTLKIRALASGTVLRSIAFPVPLTALALDPGEHAVYVGSSQGTIFDVPLVTSIQRRQDEGISESKFVPMPGHSRAITCLALTRNATHLVSGSEDATIIVWDLRSRQPIRTITNVTKNGGPVSGILLSPRPEHMPAGVVSGTRKGPQRIQPLAQFSKYPSNIADVIVSMQGGGGGSGSGNGSGSGDGQRYLPGGGLQNVRL